MVDIRKLLLKAGFNSGTCRKLRSLCNPPVKLRIELFPAVIRSYVKLIQHIHNHRSPDVQAPIFFQSMFQILEKIMPVIYKFLIQLYIRGINPLADLYLASVILRTLMDLKEVAEGPVSYSLPSGKRRQNPGL